MSSLKGEGNCLQNLLSEDNFPHLIQNYHKPYTSFYIIIPSFGIISIIIIVLVILILECDDRKLSSASNTVNLNFSGFCSVFLYFSFYGDDIFNILESICGIFGWCLWCLGKCIWWLGMMYLAIATMFLVNVYSWFSVIGMISIWDVVFGIWMDIWYLLWRTLYLWCTIVIVQILYVHFSDHGISFIINSISHISIIIEKMEEQRTPPLSIVILQAGQQ